MKICVGAKFRVCVGDIYMEYDHYPYSGNIFAGFSFAQYILQTIFSTLDDWALE